MAATKTFDPMDVYTEESRARGLYITAAHYDPATQTIHVKLKAGMTISFPKERSQVTAHATDEDLSEMVVSPAGWTADFPRIDDGITIQGLLTGKFGNAAWERKWAEEHAELQAA